MIEHTLKIRVRYADTDQMGYVYYGKYATYYEVARTEMLRTLGISYQSLEESGIMMPVLKVESLYKAPAHYDEELSLQVRIKELPQTRITFEVDIYNAEQKLIHQGSTTLVFIHAQSRKPCRCPLSLYQLLESHF